MDVSDLVEKLNLSLFVDWIINYEEVDVHTR